MKKTLIKLEIDIGMSASNRKDNSLSKKMFSGWEDECSTEESFKCDITRI